MHTTNSLESSSLMRTIAPTVLSVLVLSACASRPDFIAPPRIHFDVAEETINSPQFNQRTRAMVGDNLFVERVRTTKQGYSIALLNSGISSLDNGYTLKVESGSVGPQMQLSGKYVAFCENLTAHPKTLDVLRKPAAACLVDFDGDSSFEKTMFLNYDRYFDIEPPIAYTKEKLTPVSEMRQNAFRREAIYQGVNNGSIRLLFREYINDHIRPAFTQEIAYDLDSSGRASIYFLGFKAEVHEATSTSLDYSVISNFDK